MKPTQVTRAIFMAALSIAAVSFIHGQNSQPLSTKEVKTLIATAKTPQDHRRLAAYYLQQAKILDLAGKDHAEMAEIYKKQPLSFEGKMPYGAVGSSHCKKFADLFASQAKEAKALADLHEGLAKAAEQQR